MDIYDHNFKSSGALENKYYATKKWLESGLQYQDSIEHNIKGSERLEGCFLGSKYGRTLTENISSTSGHRRTECVRPPWVETF